MGWGSLEGLLGWGLGGGEGVHQSPIESGSRKRKKEKKTDSGLHIFFSFPHSLVSSNSASEKELRRSSRLLSGFLLNF